MRGVNGGRGSGRSWRLATVAGLVAAALVAVSAPNGSGGAVSGYVPLPSPARLVDTRPGATTVDGQDAGIGQRAAGSTLDVQVGGRAGVPPGADNVVLTVTAVDSAAIGFLTVHPAGAVLPTASNVNFYPNHNTAGAAIARLGTDGKVSIYTSAATDLIVDVAGYFPTGAYSPLPNPARLADTRPGAATIDGQAAGIGLRSAGSTLELQVAGRAGIPTDADVAVLNITAVDEPDTGFLTVHPTGTPKPNASNVNFYPNHNIANTVLAPLGDDGKVSIYTSAATQLIVDVAGHLPASSYTPLPASARLADTRPGATTTDGALAGGGIVAGGHSLQIPVAGRAGVPADASAVVLNVAAVDPYSTGYATAYPTGTPLPTASTVNYYEAHNTADAVISRIGAGGDVCVFASAATHLIVDVSGYLTGPPPAAAGPTCPQPPPILAVWPAYNVVFETPEAAAASFADQFPVIGDPQLGAYAPTGPNTGQIDFASYVPPHVIHRSLLTLGRFGADGGWFVVEGTINWNSITSPASGATVAAGSIFVNGVGDGLGVLVRAFQPGSYGPFIDKTFAPAPSGPTGHVSTPYPYTAILDLSGTSAGDVVAVLAGGVGIEGNVAPYSFSVVPVLIAG